MALSHRAQKRRTTKIFLLLLCALILFSLNNKCLAFSYKSSGGKIGHKDLWYACLGIAPESGKNPSFEHVLSTVSDAIDKDWETANKRITKKFGLERGLRNHRYYFHWGYDGKPRETAGHLDYLNNRKDWQALSKADQSRLFRELQSMWKTRQRKIENTIRREMPFLSRSKRRALGVILYDIHILGDYSTTNNDQITPLMYLDDIAREVTQKGLKKLFGGNSGPAVRAIRSKTWQKRHVGMSAEQKQARDMLNILITSLPSLIKAEMEEPFSARFGLPLQGKPLQKLTPKWTLERLY